MKQAGDWSAEHVANSLQNRHIPRLSLYTPPSCPWSPMIKGPPMLEACTKNWSSVYKKRRFSLSFYIAFDTAYFGEITYSPPPGQFALVCIIFPAAPHVPRRCARSEVGVAPPLGLDRGLTTCNFSSRTKRGHQKEEKNSHPHSAAPAVYLWIASLPVACVAAAGRPFAVAAAVSVRVSL